jgi:hypothetical protein
MPGVSISSFNSSINLVIPGLYSSGVLLQQFAVNDILDSEPQTITEYRVGADRQGAGGLVFNPTKFRMMFQANSESIQVFYDWKSAQQDNDIIFATMKIIVPALGFDVDLDEVLCESLPFLPPLKKIAEELTVSMSANPNWATTQT